MLKITIEDLRSLEDPTIIYSPHIILSTQYDAKGEEDKGTQLMVLGKTNGLDYANQVIATLEGLLQHMSSQPKLAYILIKVLNDMYPELFTHVDLEALFKALTTPSTTSTTTEQQ